MHREDETAHDELPRDGERVLREEIERLRSELADREGRLERARERFDHELLQARRELAQARLAQEELSEALHARHAHAQPAPSRSLQKRAGSGSWLRRTARSVLRTRRDAAVQRDLQLLLRSELFDADWYLSEYPDVAGSGMEPAEHYLRFGAPEGRNPGPLFSTSQYMLDHPELGEDGVNPLVHFLRTRAGVTDPR
jgi:hypothetical protein